MKDVQIKSKIFMSECEMLLLIRGIPIQHNKNVLKVYHTNMLNIFLSFPTNMQANH